MAHTYSSVLFHCVFSTRERAKIIPAELRSDLWAYVGGIARNHSMKALAVGGTDDHLHALLSLPPAMATAKAMQVIKACSSKWIRQRRRCPADFAWQEGYGAFTIGKSQVDATIAYINDQEKHHRVRSFQEEFLLLLRKHEIAYDERDVW